MNDSIHSSLPSKTEAWDALTRLALDLSWTYNHSADEIWKRLDPELWDLTANPWLILHSMSNRKLDALKLEAQTDPAFRQRIDQLLTELNEKKASPAWFQTAHPSSPLRTVAYFSMEYMLSEALPILGGHLKTGHTWTLQNRPTERNQNKSIYNLREVVRANIFFHDQPVAIYADFTSPETSFCSDARLKRVAE